MLPTAVFSDLRQRPPYLVTARFDTEVVQIDETICRGGSGLTPRLLAVSGFSPQRRE
jgi:hypothetical protein